MMLALQFRAKRADSWRSCQSRFRVEGMGLAEKRALTRARADRVAMDGGFPIRWSKPPPLPAGSDGATNPVARVRFPLT